MDGATRPKTKLQDTTALAQTTRTRQRASLLLIYSFKIRFAFQQTVPLSRLVKCTNNQKYFPHANSPCKKQYWPSMTSTFEHDLARVKANQHARYLRQSSCHSKVIAQTDRQTDGHTLRVHAS